jgi:hypothetical protein
VNSIDTIRRWLLDGATIKATDPDGFVLEDGFIAGITVEWPQLTKGGGPTHEERKAERVARANHQERHWDQQQAVHYPDATEGTKAL